MEVNLTTKIQMNVLKIFEIQRLFLSDAIIFALVQYSIPQIKGNGSISWSILGILFMVSLTTLLFSQGIEKRFSKAFYLCSIPIIIIGTWLGDIPTFEIFLLFIFSLWRLKVLFTEDGDEDSENILSSRLLATILIFIVWYFIGYISGQKSRTLLIIFPILQIFLYSYGTFLKRFIQSSSLSKKTLVTFSCLLIIIPIVLSVAVSFIASFIKDGLSIVFDKVFWFIITLFSPLINLINQYFENGYAEYDNRLVNYSKKRFELRMPESNEGKLFESLQTEHYNFYIMLGVIIIAFIVFTFVLHFKKRKVKNAKVGNKSTQNTIHKLLDKQNKTIIYPSYYSKSTEKIRKYVLELERFAVKQKLDRSGAESVRGWLNRLNIQVSEKWLAIYENVRYGSIQVTENEVEQFKLEMELIKNKMKKYDKE